MSLRDRDLGLKAVDELFMTDEERKENKTRGLETWGTSKIRDQKKKIYKGD